MRPRERKTQACRSVACPAVPCRPSTTGYTRAGYGTMGLLRAARVRREPEVSNWYVITGGPSSGKTTMVNLLRRRGFRTTIEHARHYIDLQRLGGHSIAEIRSRQLEFQRNVLSMQLEKEAALDPDEIVFVDRALPDSLAYYRFLNLPPIPNCSKPSRA